MHTPLLHFTLVLVSAAQLLGASPRGFSTRETVGRRPAGRVVTPVNQVVTPTGRQVDLPGMRPQAMALSPDGQLLVVSGKTAEVAVLNPETGAILQSVKLPNDKLNEPNPSVVSSNILKPDKDGQVSFTGLIFSPNSRRIYLSNVNGSIKVFDVSANGTVSGSFSMPLPLAHAPRRKEEIPAGMAISPDGSRLYVCFNLSNRLAELEASTGRVLRTFAVGVAPYDVVLVGDRAYVSNWGGRRPETGELTGPAGRGTTVRVDPVRHIASEGSVSVIDLTSGILRREIVTGLHASGLAVSPDGPYVVCANAGADTLSVISTRSETVVETIWVKAKPSDIFGASPNALAFDPKGRRLYVANGTQNAIGVIQFDPRDRESRLEGLIPVGWFPGVVLHDVRRKQLLVANIKGIGDKHGKGENKIPGFNSHQYYGSVSIVPVPSKRDLTAFSAVVDGNLRREAIRNSRLPPRPGQPPRPVPERIGEPSVFKHVVYIIKENRTYDQVLGDVAGGNGDPRLCIFGEHITPNLHQLVKEYVLLDNTYCAGILSADGHQWSMTAFATDYMERSFAGFPRSYPDGMGEDESDALAYSPGGFIWDNALKHGKTLRDYGEFAAPGVRWRDSKRKGSPKFLDCYRTWMGENNSVVFSSSPMVESLRPYMPTQYVGWNMAVPDQYRADFFIKELKEFEVRGEFPNLVLICLPNDHTSGTSKGSPTPAAQVADNDLAMGRIIEALSNSRFWPETAVFAIEDDPQAGWDHVSGYRTTAYCVSPYTKRGAVVSTQYNTTSLLRTVEQILGLPPMNQFDASATPMFDCFQATADLRPYGARPANIPLDQMNPDPKAIADPELRRDAIVSSRLNLKKPDACPEDVLNRILWRAVRGVANPYPEWAVMKGVDDDD